MPCLITSVVVRNIVLFMSVSAQALFFNYLGVRIDFTYFIICKCFGICIFNVFFFFFW